MSEYKKWEYDGKFFASRGEDGSFDSYSGEGDIGSGGGVRTNMFLTAEGREYWILYDQTLVQLKREVSYNRALKQELDKVVTVKGAWRNLKMVLQKNYGVRRQDL